VRIDRIDVGRTDAGMPDGFLDAPAHRPRIWGHDMMSVGSHPPSGQFDPIGQAVGRGKRTRTQQDASGPLGNDESPPEQRKRATGVLRWRGLFSFLGAIRPVHRRESGHNRFHQRKVHGPANGQIRHPLGNEHRPQDQGTTPGGAGGYDGGDGPGRPGDDGNLAAHHVDAGIGIHERRREFPGRRESPVRIDQCVQPADCGAERDGRPGRELRYDCDSGPRKGTHHHKKRVPEDGGRPVGHLTGPQERIRGGVDFGNLAGDPDRESVAKRKAGQHPYAAFPRRSPAPLFFLLRPQRRYKVISENDRLFVHIHHTFPA